MSLTFCIRSSFVILNATVGDGSIGETGLEEGSEIEEEEEGED